MLQLRPNCECCNRDLPPESLDARMCSFECTFCVTCAEGVLGGALDDATGVHGHLDAGLLALGADLHGLNAEGGLLIVLGQAVQQVEAGRDALGHRRLGERRQRMVVQLGRGGGELGERRHQRQRRGQQDPRGQAQRTAESNPSLRPAYDLPILHTLQPPRMASWLRQRSP